VRPERLVEVIVDKIGGTHRGSGYRITTTTVLTAWHVVDGATRLEVRFDSGLPTARTVIAETLGGDPESDLALLSFAATDRIDPEPPARLTGAGADVEVRIAGFPRWKLRGGKYRDSAAEPGTAALLANRREGTLQITVAPPADDPDARTPWEGISGGPVFARDRLVAVVSRHHRREGLNRLTATPIARWVDRLTDDGPPELLAALGLNPSSSLPAVAVAPVSAYRTQVREIAPEKLVGRETELAELGRFCAGPESYAWWQAPPWAGKTALMSSFVVNPPPEVEVVSFFVTGRLAGQADSTAFTDALLDQLAAVLGREVPPGSGPATREPLRRQLLIEAADRCAVAGRRLVLVVDGLDEDTGTTPGSEVPSIASLLPARPGPGLKVIVAGRPHPPIPGDVPGDHPLRGCPVTELCPSSFAQDIARQAVRELGRHLAHGDIQRDLAGLLAAAGGGLTLDDLIELAGQPRYAVDDVVNGVFGRTVERRDDVYLFAHEVLQALAMEQLGATELGRYRDRIHAWAAGYRERGWPGETPGYLLRGYVGLLRELRDVPRLIAASTDRVRHDHMLARLYTDTAALADISATQRMLLAEAEPDLVALGRLAVHQDVLVQRNLNMNPDIPLLWRRLGFPDRATALAESITDPGRRSRALRQLARQAVAEGDEQGVLSLLGKLDTSSRQAVTIAAIQAADGAPERIRPLLDLELGASAATPVAGRRRQLVGLAVPLVRAGDRANLEYLIAGIGGPESQAEVLLSLADECDQPDVRMDRRTLAQIGLSIAAGWPPSVDRGRALTVLDQLRRYDSAPAGSALNRSTSIAPSMSTEFHPDEDFADSFEWDDDFADSLPDSFSASHERSAAASTLAGSGSPSIVRATDWLGQAEARWESGDKTESRALLDRAVAAIEAPFAADGTAFHHRVARLAAALGGLDHVAAIAGSIGRPTGFHVACAGLGVAASASEPAAVAVLLEAAVKMLDWSPATVETLIRAACRAGYADHLGHALRRHMWLWDDAGCADMARVFAAEGVPDQAMVVLLHVGSEEVRARAVDEILATGINGGSFAKALDLALESPPAGRVDALVAVARMATGVDDATARDAAAAAELAARSRPDPRWQIDVLRQLSGLTAAAGDPSTTTAVLRTVREMAGGLDTLFDRIGRAAAEKDIRLLRFLGPLGVVAARETDDPDQHGELIARLARTVAAEDTAYTDLLLSVSERLIAAIPAADRRDWALADLVWAAAEAGNFDQAGRAIDLVENPDRRAELQVDLARSLAVANDGRRAEAVAAGIAVEGRRADAYLEIVRAVIRSGRWDRAVTAAHAIISLDARSQALVLVAQAAARAGDLTSAHAVAATIPGPAWRAWAVNCVEETTPASTQPRPDDGGVVPSRNGLVPAAVLSLLRRLTREPTRPGSSREAAEAFVAQGSLEPLIGLLHDQAAVVSAVAAETVTLMTTHSR